MNFFARGPTNFERTFGGAHPKIAAALENYAQLLRAQASAAEKRARQIEADFKTTSRLSSVRTPTIDPKFARFRIRVVPSRIHRWGVVAEEDIPPRRKVIEYTGERISREETNRRSTRKLHYFFILDNYWRLDGAVGGSGAEYINHSCDPNLKTRKIGQHIFYFSKRPIAAGEELSVDYKFSRSAERVPCRCGASNCRGTINLK